MGRPSRTGSVDPELRVVVGDDSYLVRAGITRALEHSHDVAVVGVGVDLPSLRRVVEEKLPDVLLTDIRMPPSGTNEGIALATELERTHPEVGVVVLSQYAQPTSAMTLFEGGNPHRAYLLKDRVSDLDFLAHALHSVADGTPLLDPKIVAMLIGPARAPQIRVWRLTAREHDILELVAEGASNRAIAAKLAITTRAVERHVNSIFGKLELEEAPDSNRRVLAAVLYARGSLGAPADAPR